MRKALRIAAAAALVGLSLGAVTAAPTRLPAAHAAPKLTLQLWYHAYGEAGTHEAVLRYAKEYEQKTGVAVNVTWVLGQGAYDPKLSTALLGSNGPDVFEGSPTLQMVKAGQVATLDDLLTPEIRKDFDPRSLQVDMIKGHTYAVQMIIDTGFLYYRKSLFQKAGIKNGPTTFSELMADAKKLNAHGVKGLFVGNDQGVTALGGLLVNSAGVNLLNDAGNKVTFDSPRTVQAMQALRDLNKSGLLLLGSPQDWWDPSAFTQGLAAMQWCGLWAMPGVRKAVGNDFGVVAWPALDAKGTPATFFGGWHEMVNGHGKHIAESKALLKWMWIENRKLQADWSTAYGFHIPPRKSAVAQATKLETGQAADAVTNMGKYARLTPNTWDNAMNTAFNDMVGKVVKTGDPIAPLVHQAAVKAQTELDRELK